MPHHLGEIMYAKFTNLHGRDALTLIGVNLQKLICVSNLSSFHSQKCLHHFILYASVKSQTFVMDKEIVASK